MNKFISIFAVFILLTISSNLIGQVLIQKSDKQIVILGKKYYLHEIKKGQTLYSISKAYNVEEHVLISENTELVNGLKVGHEIKIPVDKSSGYIAQNNVEEYIYHTVEKKQTLFYLSNKYNISEAELLRLNPEISQGLKSGQILKIPKPGTISDETHTDYKLHTVELGETMFSLSQKYGIEISDLKYNNPELNNQGLKVGQVIRIPIAKKSFADALKITHNENSANASLNYDPLYFEQPGVIPCSEFRYNSNITFKVAVLLPFFIKENLLSKNSSNYYKYYSTNTNRFYEFYQGLLLAAKRMKENGVSVEFYVKDTRANAATTREILQDEQLKDMDLIIGPVYAEPFKVASAFAKANKINIVAPFKQKYEELVADNPFIFLTNPSDETEISCLSRYLAKSPDRCVIVVHNGTAEEMKIAETFKNKLVSSYSSNENVHEIVFKQVNYASGYIQSLEDALSVGLENIIIIPSKDEFFIANLSSKINAFTKKYKISVYGLIPWEQFRSVEMEHLQNINFHYGTTNFVDYQNEDVKLFDFQYKAYFKSETSLFSYLGYDVAYYFLNVMKNYGKNFQFCMGVQNNKKYNLGLRYDFKFERVSPYSGFENNWLRIVKVDKDLQVVKVN